MGTAEGCARPVGRYCGPSAGWSLGCLVLLVLARLGVLQGWMQICPCEIAGVRDWVLVGALGDQ